MSFKSRYPDFAAIEHHIRRARAERAVAIGAACADAIMAAGRGVKRLAAAAAPALKRGSKGALLVKASIPRPAPR